MDEFISVSSTWPPKPTSVPEARAFVSQRLDGRLSEDASAGALVVVSELATNAVQHARTPFTVTVEWSGLTVTVKVADGSPQVPAGPLQDLMATHGRGLQLLDALSLSWGVSVQAGGGKAVWARFTASR